MPANGLSVRTDEMRTLSQDFATLSGDLDTLYTTISQKADALETVWEGDAATAFLTDIRSTYKTFTDAVSYLSTVSTNLITAADNYDSAETSSTVGSGASV